MDRILEIDRENLVAVVQPGVINAHLKAAVAAEGLFYPPDPASYELCSIGGNLGTNAGGLCCVKYGQTRDSVLALEVVMADGTIIRTGGKNIKDVAGYSLTHLFVGSQGTLAITTEATLRLRPAPPPRATMLAFFPTLDGAGDAVAGIAAAGLSPVTLELLDKFTIAAVDDMNNLGLDRTAAAMLMIESDRRRRHRRARTCGSRLPRRRCDGRHPRGGRAGGRLASPGTPRRALRARTSRRGAHGGHRRTAFARAGHASRDRADRGPP
jgi:glycolate oxidase